MTASRSQMTSCIKTGGFEYRIPIAVSQTCRTAQYLASRDTSFGGAAARPFAVLILGGGSLTRR